MFVLAMRLSLLLVASAVLAACVGGGIGHDRAGATVGRARVFQGVLQNVDHGNRRLLLREEAGGRVWDIGYDAAIGLDVDGQPRPSSELEPGDRVRVEATGDADGWRVGRMTLVADGRGLASAGPVLVSGVVSAVDAAAGVIAITEGGVTGDMRELAFDRDTRIDGIDPPPEVAGLRRGDGVRITARRRGERMLAERITVHARADGD